ncbi:MAG: hypothetical protein OQK32_04730, partial [Gammaproteobacteria bacterium]|nr:hypothetical protein [Gammaproteobacteria bacterium]
LQENSRYVEAKTYLLKAQQAAPRPDRPIADRGRHQQIRALLAVIKEELEETLDNENEELE